MTHQALYDSLNESSQDILKVFSVYYAGVSNASEFSSFLSKMKIKDENNKAFNTSTGAAVRDMLIKKGVLVNQQYQGGIQFKDLEFKEFLMLKASEQADFQDVISKIQTEYPAGVHNRWSYTNSNYTERIVRDFRMAIYSNDAKYLADVLKNKPDEFYNQLFVEANEYGWDYRNLKQYTTSVAQEALAAITALKLTTWQPIDEYLEFWVECKLPKNAEYEYRLMTIQFLKGEHKSLEKTLKKATSLDYSQMAIWGLIEVMNGRYEEAIKIYEESIKSWKKWTNKKKGYPSEWSMVGYAMALAKTNESKLLTFYEEYLKYAEKNFHPDQQKYVLMIGSLYHFFKNQDNVAVSRLARPTFNPEYTLSSYVFLCLSSNIPKAPFEKNQVISMLENAQACNFKLIEREALFHIQRKSSISGGLSKSQAERLQELNQLIGNEPLGNIIPAIEDWERSLTVLSSLADSLENKKGGVGNEITVRVGWVIDFKAKEIQPVEQKLGKTGWTGGRNIALKRFSNNDIDFASPQDYKVSREGLKEEVYSSGWGNYGSTVFRFDWDDSLPHLIDHPYLFLGGASSLPLTLVKGDVSLQIKQEKNNLQIGFDNDFENVGTFVVKETATRYKVFEITPLHLKIQQSFGGNKSLNIPSSGKDKLLKSLAPLSKQIAIQSNLDVQIDNLPVVKADTRIYALLNPLNDGFHLEFFVKPFGSEAPYLKPGKGSENIIGTVKGVRSQTKRDLKKETKILKEVEEMCPTLISNSGSTYEWMLDTPEDCLDVMIELEEPKRKEKLVIEWPKGQKLKLMGNINFETLKMNITSKNNWFEVSGEAKVDDGLVLSLKELLLKLNGESNFVELSDGQFVAITEKLRKYLQTMRAVLDDKMRGNILASSALEELSDEVKNFKADKAWKENIQRLKDVRSVRAEIPSTFQAELRPYQEEGFQWLSQLSHWGVGACLADDMGLGKTIQALAILLQRAEQGPALVVAPLSVCRNWEREALKFAPTLNLILFAGNAQERKDLLQNAKGFDVVVVSYGLLQTEEELFKQTKFSTILLDEAQAIKNRTTKRSKTVMALDGDFRIITTGTPVENHLGELWNIFNFINPGLLGSHDSFNERFAIPIEKNNSLERRKALQKLIKPFILRRRKNQVLDDLPAKTEIILNVEMSTEERSFYESVRQDALQRIESDAGAVQDKRFRILAELTRLRLACCHPKLVNPSIPLNSSKLELFGEIVEELIENKHKALVFSQFTKHLAIIEEYLNSQNIKYQYLDGSTPAKQRQERIDDFQRGNGDIFLISLKAGGTGLNLTAADYVIHLDPWWNPAVEDQATDRAHRMGQQRPVTVYRFVTEDSVESKILKLHETKRDLADGLLEGSEGSGKMSAEQLMDLIRER